MERFEPLIREARVTGKPLRLAVFVSGNGSNLQALIDDSLRDGCPYAISLVVSNEPDAFALIRARNASIPTEIISHRGLKRESFEESLCRVCEEHAINLVVLAGFMRVLKSTFLARYKDRVINLHPALCPAFPGLHAVQQALKKGVWYTGCTVHLVNEGVDTGPIIAQAIVPVYQDDTEKKLSERIHIKEHALLVAVVRRISLGEVLYDGQTIKLTNRDLLLKAN